MTTTPRPWLLMPGGLGISSNDPEQTRYQEIARMVDGNTTCQHLHVTADEQKANAQLIIKAVNSYEAMQEALELSRRNCEALIYALPVDVDETDKQSLSTWLKRIEAALALADSQPV